MSGGEWTEAEVEQLAEMRARGWGLASMGDALGRSADAVRRKIDRLGWGEEVDERLHQRASESRVAEELRRVVRRIDRGLSPASLRLALTRMVRELEGGAA